MSGYRKALAPAPAEVAAVEDAATAKVTLITPEKWDGYVWKQSGQANLAKIERAREAYGKTHHA